MQHLFAMGIGVEEGYKEFVQYHEQQLRHVGFPEEAWRQVYEKLQPRTVHDIDKGLEVKDGKVVASKPHQPFSCVYIVPHLWTGDGGAQSFAALEDDIDQPAKLLDLMGDSESHSGGIPGGNADIIKEIAQMTGSSEETAKTAYNEAKGDLVNAVVLLTGNDKNIEGNKIANALGLEDKNKTISFAEFKAAITDQKSEYQLEQMYKDFVRKKQAALGEDGFGTTSNYKWEDDAEEHVITVTIPVPPGTKRGDVISKITTKRWTFGIKGQAPIIYGSFAGIVQPDECTWYFEKGTDNIIASIQKSDNEEFLWLNLIVGEEKISERFLEYERRKNLVKALDMLWYNALTYQAITPEGTQAHNWYLPPQTVSKMLHSESPNFQLAPFWSCYGGKVLTLLWPIKTIKVSETCTLEKNRVLYTGEPDLQREARIWAANPANISKSLPKSFTSQYENLNPPFTHKVTDWNLPEDDVLSETENVEELTIVTSMNLSDVAKTELKKLGVVVSEGVVSSEEVPDTYICHWKQFREDRSGISNVNSFDPTLTNLIRLNSFVRSSFGNVSWWPSGYHLNKELPAILAFPPSWEAQWLLRCSEKAAASVITNSPARLVKMCENSLNYFAQPYVNSVTIDDRQCSLEFTLVIRNRKCFVSNIPAVHICRKPVNDMEENHYLIDHYISRSDGSNFPSALWSRFLVEFSLNEAWPVTESKIHHMIYDLFSSFVKKTTEVHCYGIQVIITPSLEVKLVGVRPSPTYFPSLEHLAAAWKLLFCRPLPVVKGFRNIFNASE